MGNLGWTEILIILGIALIVFGPRELPQLGKSLGESLAQFRRASEDFKRTWESEVEEERRKIDRPNYQYPIEPYPPETESEVKAETEAASSEEKAEAQKSEVEPVMAESK